MPTIIAVWAVVWALVTAGVAVVGIRSSAGSGRQRR